MKMKILRLPTTGAGGACTGAVLFQGPEDFSTPPPPPPPSSQLSPGSSLFSLSSSSFSLLERNRGYYLFYTGDSHLTSCEKKDFTAEKVSENHMV